MNLKKCLLGLTLGGVALWFAGCSESASTAKPSSGTASSKANSDVSATSGAAADAKSGSGSEGADKTGADDEQAGSSTGGRDVPEAAPPSDEEGSK